MEQGDIIGRKNIYDNNNNGFVDALNTVTNAISYAVETIDFPLETAYLIGHLQGITTELENQCIAAYGKDWRNKFIYEH